MCLADSLYREARLPDHLGRAARGKNTDRLLDKALSQVQQARLVKDRNDRNLLSGRHICCELGRATIAAMKARNDFLFTSKRVLIKFGETVGCLLSKAVGESFERPRAWRLLKSAQ